MDDFTITCRSLGRLKELLIGHDNAGMGAAWHLERVDITDVATGVVSSGVYASCMQLPIMVTTKFRFIVHRCLQNAANKRIGAPFARIRAAASSGKSVGAMRAPPAPFMQTFYFECGRWLSSTDEDRRTERVLQASLEPARKTNYTVGACRAEAPGWLCSIRALG